MSDEPQWMLKCDVEAERMQHIVPASTCEHMHPKPGALVSSVFLTQNGMTTVLDEKLPTDWSRSTHLPLDLDASCHLLSLVP